MVNTIFTVEAEFGNQQIVIEFMVAEHQEDDGKISRWPEEIKVIEVERGGKDMVDFLNNLNFQKLWLTEYVQDLDNYLMNAWESRND